MRTSVAILFITILVLFTIGSIAIYSLDFAKEYYYSQSSNLFEKYIVNIILGTVTFLTFAFFMPVQSLQIHHYLSLLKLFLTAMAFVWKNKN